MSGYGINPKQKIIKEEQWETTIVSYFYEFDRLVGLQTCSTRILNPSQGQELTLHCANFLLTQNTFLQ